VQSRVHRSRARTGQGVSRTRLRRPAFWAAQGRRRKCRGTVRPDTHLGPFQSRVGRKSWRSDGIDRLSSKYACDPLVALDEHPVEGVGTPARRLLMRQPTATPGYRPQRDASRRVEIGEGARGSTHVAVMLVNAYSSQQEARRAEHAGDQTCAESARAASEVDSSKGTSVSIGNGMASS